MKDWAERAAHKVFIEHYGAITIAAVARVLRRARKLKEAERKAAEKRGYEQGYREGFYLGAAYNADE